MGTRPRILVTTGADPAEDYAERVREAGGDPAIARPGEPLPPWDGLLLTGGTDIDPSRYGQPPHERLLSPDPGRDALEFALLEHALGRDLPVLAICRGHQLFNVVHGGSLLQHIEQPEPHLSQRDPNGGDRLSRWHEVTIAPGTLLAAILGDSRQRVNSRHHQAVTADRVAPELLVAATSDDGIVEALERPDLHWALSVQWHPERGELAPQHRALFAAFVQACRGEIGG